MYQLPIIARKYNDIERQPMILKVILSRISRFCRPFYLTSGRLFFPNSIPGFIMSKYLCVYIIENRITGNIPMKT